MGHLAIYPTVNVVAHAIATLGKYRLLLREANPFPMLDKVGLASGERGVFQVFQPFNNAARQSSFFPGRSIYAAWTKSAIFSTDSV
jgi:hypothetical protein